MPDREALNTITFNEVRGRTTPWIRMQLASKHDRDTVIESGMEGGMQEVMELLDQVAVSLG